MASRQNLQIEVPVKLKLTMQDIQSQIKVLRDQLKNISPDSDKFKGLQRQIESLDNKLIDSESASYADLISTDENIEEGYIKKCERQIIKKFINKLNEKEKTIFNMYFIQDMSQNQISKKLCISQPQVSKKIRKVLEELKTIMLKENEENKHIAMPKIKQM